MEAATMNTSTVDSFAVEHREYPSEHGFEQVVAAFERLVPPVGSATLAVEVARAAGAEDLEQYLRAQAGPSGFMRFADFDHGAWLAKLGRSARIRSYILGNPLVARTMIVHDPGVGLNVPVRLLIYEGSDRRTRVAYDVPSTLMGRLKSPEVTKAALLLDDKLRALAEEVTHAPETNEVMSSHFKTAELKFVRVRGARVAHREVGTGPSAEAPLVLLQHITGTIDDWDPYLVDELGAGRRVIAFDNAGVGASDGSAPDSIEAMADSALEFIDALGLKKVDLLGYSMGGFVAQVIAARRPETVRKVILASTGAAGGEGLEKIADVLQSAFAFAAKENKHPKQRLFFRESSDGQSAAAQFLARLREPFTQADQTAGDAAIQSQVRAFIAWGRSADVHTKAISSPTWVVAGDGDEMIPLSNAFDLTSRVRGAHLAVYPRASHGAIFQYKELFVRQANDFLKARA